MRFAHEHAPHPPKASFWLRVAIVFLLLAAPVTVLNLAVDPFDFRLAPHLPLVREKLMKRNDSVLWSVSEFRRIPQAARDLVTILFVGDSRTEGICRWPSSPRIFRMGSDVVFNLGVSGASFEESLRLMEAELPRLPRLRGVVFAVPMERLGTVGIDRTGNAFRLAANPLLYAVGLGTAASSFELAGQRGIPSSERWSKGESPDLDPRHIVDVSGEALDVPGNIARANAGQSIPLGAFEKKNAAMWRKIISRVDAHLVQRRMREVIAPLAQRLGDRDIDVVFLFPPLHPEVRRAIRPDLAEIHRRLVADLAALGSVEDFSRGDRSGIDPKFTDAMHVQPETAHAILGDVYLRNFGPGARLSAMSSDR